MDVGIAVAVVVALVVAMYIGSRFLRPPASSLSAREAIDRSVRVPKPYAGRVKVVLEIDDADPASPVVDRLVNEAAARVFAASPDAEEVEVLSNSGKVVGRRTRAAPAPKEVNIPTFLYEPHLPGHAPNLDDDLSRGSLNARPAIAPHFEPREEPKRHIPLADHLDLPGEVRSRLRDPDDPVDLVRAILEAAGVRAEVDGDLIRTSDELVVVIRARLGDVIGEDDLNHAYFRFHESGVRRGVVVTPGLLYPHEVRRREMLAPALLHTGPEGIQRMADAVAVGANPLRFSVAPPLAPSWKP